MAAPTAVVLQPIVIPDELLPFVEIRRESIDVFTVLTYTVKPDKHGDPYARGDLDATYYQHPALYDLIPLTCADLYYNNDLVACIRGMRKFTTVDADQRPAYMVDTSAMFPAEKIRTWDTAHLLQTTFQEKIDGFPFAFTLFMFQGKLWYFGGIKNTYCVDCFDHPGTIIERCDINPIPREVRIIIGRLRLSGRFDSFLEQFLNKTICGERFEKWHHVVNTNHQQSYFFDRLLPPEFEKPVELVPDIDGVPSSETLERLRYNFQDMEGVVITYTNTETGEIYRQKHYTSWYLILRNWRPCIDGGRTTPERLLARLNDIHRKYNEPILDKRPEVLVRWDLLAKTFVAWLEKSRYRGIFSGMSLIGAPMSWIWDGFLGKADS